MFASKDLMFGQQPTGGYQISRSVRLRSSASAYFNRTPSSAGNQQKWTFSAWVKRGQTTDTAVFGVGTSGSNYFNIRFQPDYLSVVSETPSLTIELRTSALYRDYSAWYHIVLALDTTQATASDRAKLYVNGVQVTSFSTATYPSLNANLLPNSAVAHYLGVTGQATAYADGYFTEVNFVNAQQLAPTSFGAFDAVTGVWNPTRYSGTYGTNGFYLNFKDPTSTTTIGYDYSGNSNNWTANNISVTAGTTYDSMVDSPTNYGADTGVGGTVRGNYATLNPLANGTAAYVKDGNLRINPSDGNFQPSLSTIGVSSGKWYAECTITAVGSGAIVGIGQLPSTLVATNYLGNTATSWGYYGDGTNARLYNNSSFTSYGATYTTGAVIGVALDMDAGTLVFYRNGTSQGTAVTGLSGTYAIGASPAGSAGIADMNFGQRPFAYTAPTGYKALCTQNLTAPTISNGANYFAATIWTGNGAASVTVNNSVNSISFQPDFVWAKNRTTAVGHSLYDSIRGAGANTELNSASTNAEGAGNQDQYGYLSAFNSNGFTGVNGSSSPNYYFNESGSGFVGWQWKGGGAGVSNTAGSITSTVSANTTAGFSVVTYTGTGANATVGHGLGIAPSLLIVKERNTTRDWPVWHSGILGTQFLSLNSTDAIQTVAAVWNSTIPTSTVFSVGTNLATNQSTGTYVAYCFAPISGYSAFGSYTGNGSIDGPFIYLGFRPRFVLWKRSDSTGSWYIQDTSRNPYNQATLSLYPNLSDAETSGDDMDYLSNGFKVRDTFSYINASGGSYIYAAFAENPFTISRAR